MARGGWAHDQAPGSAPRAGRPRRGCGADVRRGGRRVRGCSLWAQPARPLAGPPPEGQQNAGGHQEGVLPRVLPCQLRPARRWRGARLGILQGLAQRAHRVDACRQRAAWAGRVGTRAGWSMPAGAAPSCAALCWPHTHSCAHVTLTPSAPARPACRRTTSRRCDAPRCAARATARRAHQCCSELAQIAATTSVVQHMLQSCKVCTSSLPVAASRVCPYLTVQQNLQTLG